VSESLGGSWCRTGCCGVNVSDVGLLGKTRKASAFLQVSFSEVWVGVVPVECIP
jgi:hypothetical protein